MVCDEKSHEMDDFGVPPFCGYLQILAEFQVSRLSWRRQLMGLGAQPGRFPFGLPNSKLEGDICNETDTPWIPLDCNMTTTISTKTCPKSFTFVFFSPGKKRCGAATSKATPRPVELHAVSMEADGEGIVDHHLSMTRGQSGGLENLKVFDEINQVAAGEW